MSDMLERCEYAALAAIRAQDGFVVDIRPVARAVLEALREPTSDVLSAGERALVHCSPVHWGRAKAVWQAAIDTALKDTP